MSDLAKRLLEERANTWEQAKALLDRAEAEKRELSAEENESYERMTADMRSKKERADELAQIERENRSAAATLEEFRTAPKERTPEPAGDPRMEEVRKFLRGEVRSVEIKPTTEEIRALSVGTAGAGGNTVPTSFYGILWEHLRESASLIGAGATVFNTNSGEQFELPITTSHGAAAAADEAATLAGTDPVFAKRTLGAYKFGQLIPVSRELTEDSGVDLEGYLARIVGQNLGLALGEQLILGDGSTEPSGITTTSTLGKTGATTVGGAPEMDDLIDLYYSVISPYRARPAAKWLMRDSTAAVIRKFTDSNGQYIWQPSVIEGQPDRLLSKPVVTDPFVPAVATSAKSVLFGDLSSYAVRIVNGIRFERSDDFAFDTDQITFRGVLRGDGILVDQTGAVKHFAGGAS